MTITSSVGYFDEVAASYADRYEEQTPGGYALRVRRQRLLELLDGCSGKLLDVGCGPGVMAQEMLDKGFDFWGVDAAPAMIDEARQRFTDHEQAHFSVADATSLPYPDGFFDIVTCIGVLDHADNHNAAIKEMTRVLQPGGTLVISFPNAVGPYAAWKGLVFYPAVALVRPVVYRLLRRLPLPSLYHRGFDIKSVVSYLARHQTPATAARSIAAHDAQVIDIVYFNYNIFLSPLDELFPGVAVRVSRWLERRRFGLLKWLGAGFLVKARKA